MMPYQQVSEHPIDKFLRDNIHKLKEAPRPKKAPRTSITFPFYCVVEIDGVKYNAMVTGKTRHGEAIIALDGWR